MSDDAMASDETEFWERRRDLTLAPTTEADVERRAVGRTRHLVLLAHLTDEDIVARFAPILERLGEFDCFAPEPARNLHVTVKVLGNVVEEPDDVYEFSDRDERRLAASLRSALDSAEAFTVDFPRFNLFPGVVYAEVADDGRFAGVNRLVCELADVPVRERDEAGFVPHLTLGHFTQRDGYERLLRYLEENRSLDVPSVAIDELELVALDFSDGRFPPYETVAAYDLS